jgi:Icc-related predicted phosphoesterase
MDAARQIVRVAATGDIHCRDANRDRVLDAFSRIAGEADLALLAGDLTSHGTAEEAATLCAASERFEGPIFAVLGNHDWHAGEADAIADLLDRAGINLLQGTAGVCQVDGLEVGVVGAKGFVGGFAPRHLPDFGEPSLRAVYAETTAEVEALDTGLHEVATCPIRLVVLHYSPVQATLEGEPREIFTFLGSDRLAAPILEHGPDLVVHGHAHAGTAEGRIGEVPVYNVSMPLNGSGFRIFEVEAKTRAGPIP